MEAKVFQLDGSDAGRTVPLNEAVFGVEPNDHAVWLDVRRIQAGARQGTHKAKERNEVAGSTRKLFRQKGTGMARAGSAKSPIRRSGGTIFGPRPRTYDLKVNRKTQVLARRSALSRKAEQGQVSVIESFKLERASTQAVASLIKALDLKGARVLLLTNGHNPELYRSGRNVEKVRVKNASEVSTLDVIQASVVLIEEGALDGLVAQLSPSTAAA